MKKALFISGVLTVMVAMMQSCAPNRKLPRPQGHPTPPKKVTMQYQPVQQQGASVYNS
ncbi:MAG: hypothetical protein H6551_06375 [Chitinophagales bacterium]|nr:hypothetical protein [Chitinophagaceae bacterium]MCB9064754.1 hypothetical protein [Chitinophagales bacterium]